MRLTAAQRRHVERPTPIEMPEEPPSSPETSRDVSPTASAALALVRSGMWVFPCHPRDKTPATRHSLKDARSDVRAIERWWSQEPEYNPAIDCGRSGLVVIDEDSVGEFARFCEDRGEPLPDTYRVDTARGVHWWFRQPDGVPIRSVNWFKEHGYKVDVRGDGGYVLAPGAIHPDGPTYTTANPGTPPTTLPDWLADLLRSKERKRGTPAPHGTRASGRDPDDEAPVTLAGARAALEAAVIEVEEAAEGARNDTLNAKTHRLGRMVEAGLLERDDVEAALTDAARAAGLDPREVEATIASGLDSGAKRPRLVAADKDGRTSQQETVITRVVEYAEQRYEFHRTPDGRVFAVPFEGVRRPVFITDTGGGALKSMILADLYDEWTGKVPSGATIERALEVLHAKATRRQNTHALDLRVARRGDTLVVDLGQQGNGRCVLVDGDGWRVLDNPPDGVLFRSSLRALPEPARDGSLEPLRRLLGWAADDHRWSLARGWMAAACLPDIPRPLLFLDGQPGSAKTTRARLMLSVLDPREELGSSFGRNEDDERVTAYRRYLVGWDNITRASDAVSDSLCRLVTGEESSKRTLYADTGLTVMSFRRTGAITAVSVPSLRADALERLIHVSCDPISATQRLSESRIWQQFETDHPAILGGLLDALATMLRHLPASREREDGRARMADFQDALHALDPEIAQVYASSVQDVMVEAATSDPFVSVVIEWLSAERLPLLVSTVSEARLAAAEHRPSTDPRDFQPWWPTTDKAFSDALAKGAEPLRAMGYRVDRLARTKRGRPLRFSRVETTVQDSLDLGGAK